MYVFDSPRIGKWVCEKAGGKYQDGNYCFGIEKDGIITPIRPFNDNNLSFLPAGKLGELKNALPMEQLHPVEGISYANFGPTLVSKWRSNDPIQEWTGMELNAFPAIDVDGIFILKTETVQASFNGTGS